MNKRTLKETLIQFCIAFAKGRVRRIRDSIVDVRESLEAEDKNTAGDKHETGRAMLQLEREKLGQQLVEAEKMERDLEKVMTKVVSSNVALGSLVLTSKNNYFLAISAGEYKSSEISVYCISLATPMAQLLLGKSSGETIIFNGENITISEVV